MDRNFQRLMDTLAVLQRGQRLSTPEIRDRLAARGHAVTPRTVQRDLEDLASVYPLVCDQRARPYGWSWRADAPRLALPGMDWPEAVSFQLLSTYLDDALPGCLREGIAPFVTEARRRLSQHMDRLPLRAWPQRVRVVRQGPPQAPPRVARAVHLAVTEAVLLGQCLRIRYRAFGERGARQFSVAPLGLVLYGATIYLPVRFAGHADVRTLVLHRIERALRCDEPSGIEDFDLDRWIDGGALGFGGGQTIVLRLRLWQGLGDLLAETPLARDQTVQALPDGTQQLSATVLDTAELRRWLLSLGSRVEVLAPQPLRQALANEATAVAGRYRGGGRA